MVFLRSFIFLSLVSIIPLRVAGEPSKPFLIVTRTDDNGFFSCFNTVIAALAVYEKGEYSGLNVCLQTNSYYDRKIGPNWWEYFFEPIYLGSKKNVPVEHLSMDLAYKWTWDLQVSSSTRERDYNLIKKYIHPKPFIEKKVERFVQKKFGDTFTIGVHYRGTDKMRLEAPYVAYEKMLGVIQKTMKKYKKETLIDKCCIFIATDEESFLNYIKSKFTCPIFYTKSTRSKDGTPIHLGKQYSSKYKKGEDALIDALILARCNVLIRTDSNLSFVSSRFNLNLPVVLVK